MVAVLALPGCEQLRHPTTAGGASAAPASSVMLDDQQHSRSLRRAMATHESTSAAPPSDAAPRAPHTFDQTSQYGTDSRVEGVEVFGSAAAPASPRTRNPSQGHSHDPRRHEGKIPDGTTPPVTHGAPPPTPSPPAPAVAFRGRESSGLQVNPKDASRAAKLRLSQARVAAKNGDLDVACRLAVEAYELAAAHGAASPDCSQMMVEAGQLLEAIGRRQTVVNEPTRFE